MSQSPLGPGQSKELDTYLKSWTVLNRLIEKGGSFSGHERNCCFLNTGKHPFADVSSTCGIDWADDTRGVAIVDWDRDGDLDFWASNRSAPRVRLMRNNGAMGGRQFLMLRLQGAGPHCNRDAIGARVELWSKPQGDAEEDPPRKRIKTLYAGNGFLSQSSKWIHFGLQQGETIDRVVVKWPGGSDETFRGLEPGSFHQIFQGEEATQLHVRSNGPAATPQLAKGPLMPPETSDTMRIVLARRQLLPKIEYSNLAGEPVELETNESPLLINLWADWCQPCVKELREFAQQSHRLKEAGIRVVALHVGDPKGDRKGVAEVAAPLLKRLTFSHASGVVGDETLEVLDSICDLAVGLHRELPLPSSFLLDRHRRVCVIYKGPVHVEQLLADAQSIGSVDEKYVEKAAAFAGTWHQAPSSYESLQLVRRLFKSGRVDESVDHLTRCIDHAKALSGERAKSDPSLAAMYHVLGTIQRTTGQRPQAIMSYQQALQVDPDFWAAHFDLGTIYLKMAQFDNAEKHFVAALRIKPKDADMLSKMALAQMGQERLEKAVPFLEMALELEPENETALRHLARVSSRLRKPSQAVPHLTKLLQLQPEDASLHLELGHAYHQIGQRRDALLHYRRALALRPDWLPPMNAAAWLLATQEDSTPKEVDEAVQLAEKVCRLLGRPQLSALDTLAAALASAGRFNEAIETAQSAVELAEQANAAPLVLKFRRRLDLYRQRQPYRESDIP